MTSPDMLDISDLNDDDYRKAFVEVAFLMNAFMFTIDTIMGGKTAPVGRIAGRDMADKLPLEFVNPNLKEVIETLARHEQFNAGFDFSLQGNELKFGTCVVRDMCAVRNHPPGSPPCKLFHSYFDGIINGLLHRPVKSTFTSVGEECCLQIDVQ
jgi:hypothetical protein